MVIMETTYFLGCFQGAQGTENKRGCLQAFQERLCETWPMYGSLCGTLKILPYPKVEYIEKRTLNRETLCS